MHHLILKNKEYFSNLSVEVDEVSKSGSHDFSGINEITNNLNELTHCSSANAGNIEEVTASIQEMASNTQVISQKSQKAFESSKDILNSVSIGKKEIGSIIKGISEQISLLINEIQEKANYADGILRKDKNIMDISLKKSNDITKQFKTILDRTNKITDEIRMIVQYVP